MLFRYRCKIFSTSDLGGTCYFLLNVVIGSNLTLPMSRYTMILLFSFECCLVMLIVTAVPLGIQLAIFFWMLLTLPWLLRTLYEVIEHLLFSFECCVYKRIVDNAIDVASKTCYFLLNVVHSFKVWVKPYSSITVLLFSFECCEVCWLDSCCYRGSCKLLLFSFECCSSTTYRGSQEASRTCYFLLNVVSSFLKHLLTYRSTLAIFFWMLYGYRLVVTTLR